MKKVAIIVVVIIIILVGVILFVNRDKLGVSFGPSGEVLDKDLVRGPLNTEYPVLYFYHNGFIGSNQNGKWQAPKDVQLKDIFDNEYYTIYDNSHKKSKSNRISLGFEEGLGGFRYDGFEPVYDENGNLTANGNPLINYSSENDDYEYIFEIPNKLDETLSVAYTKNLPDTRSTYVRIYNKDDEFKGGNNLIAFNSNINLKFVESSNIEELPDDVLKLLKERLSSNGISEDIPYTIKSYYKSDLNNNGKDDEVFVIESTNAQSIGLDMLLFDEEMTNSIMETGSFSIVITKVNGNVKVIDESMVGKSDESTMISLPNHFYVQLVDLNNDGIKELLYDSNGNNNWDSYLTVLDNTEYKKLK